MIKAIIIIYELMTKSSILFSPFQLNHIRLENRIVVSPMCQYSAVNGYATDWHLIHLGQFAIAKVGAIIQEATAVSPEGRISYGDLGLWEDEQIPKYAEIVSFIKSQGVIPGIQLAHAGRKASTDIPWLGKNQIHPDDPNGWQTNSSTNQPYHPSEHPPKLMSVEDIQEVIAQFKRSTIRAIAAGYQIIEIHAAHGYLIHQFLSPAINHRTDEYGGSFDNRIRFLLEIIKEIKDLISKNLSLWVRISASDWVEEGWDLQQSIRLAKELKTLGVDLIDVSSGGAVREQEIPVKPGYQVPFSAAIRKEANLSTGTVGLITNAKQAEQIIQNQEADLILIGREFLRNPHLTYHWAKELEVDFKWPDQYVRAK